MSKLDKIEADLHRLARRSDPPVFQDHGDLLVRAVRQLCIRWFQGFSVPELLRIVARDYEKGKWNAIKQRRAMWLRDLADKMDKADPDVLELIRDG